MKNVPFIIEISVLALIFNAFALLAFAGTWSDDFSGETLAPQWKGDRDNFSIVDGKLKGVNAHPILLLPLRWIKVGKDWNNYIVKCRINIVTPNLLECTKGAVVLRHKGEEGYVFALHVATKTVEVFRLSNGEMLLKKERPLELETWYDVRAELQDKDMSFYVDNELIGKITDDRSASGSVGLAVQDVLNVMFDDFTITGPGIDPESASIELRGKLPITWARLKSDL